MSVRAESVWTWIACDLGIISAGEGSLSAATASNDKWPQKNPHKCETETVLRDVRGNILG